MNKAITVRFKLHGEAANMARALQTHVREVEKLPLELDEVIKRIFINWMQQHSTQVEQALTDNAVVAEVSNEQHSEAVEIEAVSTDNKPEDTASVPDHSLLEPAEES